jgi:anti-sigma regulatory factor (Ser/Thr protein kinase)
LLAHRFDARGLSRLRAVVLAHAVAAGMPENRARDVMLAAHELAANAIRHGAGAGRLQMRTADGMLRVQVHDAGPASLNGQAGTAGRDGQDIPGGGRDGSGGSFNGSIRTVPVKYSAGPLTEGREPLRLISILHGFTLLPL